MFPILNPPPSSLLPPYSIPLGHPSAPAPSIQYRASNLDWQLVSYMIFYMFQCHSPKSSRPLPLPHFSNNFSAAAAAAAAAAKSLQLCLLLCNPRDCSPLGSPIPGILQVRTLEWVAISFSNA